MSLLDDFARTCILLEKKRVPDGAGGYIVEWTEGAEFTNYQALDTSMEARRAEKEGVTSLYSALVDKAVPIEYNDVFKDTETGQTYRGDLQSRRKGRAPFLHTAAEIFHR